MIREPPQASPATPSAKPTSARPDPGRLIARRRLVRRSLLAALLCVVGPAAAQTLDEARSLHGEGRLDEALEMYRVVAPALEATDSAAAASARNNACVILMNRGNHRAAYEECREALRLRRLTDDPRRTARTLNNTGLTLQYLGRYEQAEALFEEALSLNRAREDLASEAINWANLGVLATEASWYAKALGFYDRVVRLADQHGEEPWAAEQLRLARMNQAVVLERLGAYENALELYETVQSDSAGLTARQRAALLVNVGVVYRNLGDPVRALHAFEEAVQTYEELEDRGRLSNAYLNIALVRHLNLEDPSGAESAYRTALELAEASGDQAEQVQDLYYLGQLLTDLGRFDEATSVFERCLEASTESGSSEGRWSSLEGLGRIERARGQSREALRHLNTAIEEIEGVRGSLVEQTLRSDYFGDKRRVYEAAVGAAADLAEQESRGDHERQALQLVQQAKARTLLDALGPDAGPSEPPGLAAVLELVGTDALIEYFVTEDEVLAWVLHAGNLEMVRLGPADAILTRAAEAHRALAHGEDIAPGVLEQLSRSLLEPLAIELDGVEQLRIAPDGLLFYLPFELLLWPGRSDERLIERFTVSYLPSASSLAWLDRSETAEPQLALAGFADPRLAPPSGASPTPAQLLTSRFALSPLPSAAAELEAIRRQIPGDAELRVGEAATEPEFARITARGARVVHIATHAVVDERRGRGTAIVLSPGEDSDGLLHPTEIAALDYPVGLTVLAACSTAVGAETGGDALTSLTGSFLAAGSSAVVATLWDVDDAATRVFMEQFYHQLGRGHTPAQALRRAKQRLIADPEWNRPSLWSAYVLIGEGVPIVATGSRRILGGAGITIAIVLLWLILSRRRRATASR